MPHDNPYGSARFAAFDEVQAAGLMRSGGLPFGALNGTPLYHHNRAGVLCIGGAGAGKTTSLLIPLMLAGQNAMCLDVKGENTSVILDGLAHSGIRGYCFNPYRLFGLPHHRPALLAHLKASSPTLVGDSRRTWAALIPESGGHDGRFFDTKARQWGDAVSRGIVAERGSVSFAAIFEAVSMIRADWSAWMDRAATMAALGPPDIEATLGEMITMNTGEARTFDGVMSTITGALAFMADPQLHASLPDEHRADFTLDALCDGRGPAVLFIIMPPELLEPNAPVIRQLFSTMRTVKSRTPYADPVSLVIDEAAALGPYPEIAEFFSIGRGFGLTPVVVYQDLGQIERNLGRTGAMTLSANAALQLYLGGGIRDLDTAHMLSRRLGNQTIAVDEKLIQERARHARRKAMRSVLWGEADPIATGMELRHLDMETQHVRRQGRALMEPDEIMGLDTAQALVLAGGYQLPPFLAEKRPYYLQPELAGRVFPNPYVQRDPHQVDVPTRFGMRSRRILEAAVPSWLAHLPQYADGRPLRYVEGFPPRP